MIYSININNSKNLNFHRLKFLSDDIESNDLQLYAPNNTETASSPVMMHVNNNDDDDDENHLIVKHLNDVYKMKYSRYSKTRKYLNKSKNNKKLNRVVTTIKSNKRQLIDLNRNI